MTALFVLIAVFFVGGPLLLAAAAAVDAGRRPPGGARRVWQGALLASILTAPVLPGVPIVSAERARILEGPDLLSGAPLVRESIPTHDHFLGLVRTEGERELQSGLLLREIRRDVVVLPVLPLLLGGGWFARAGRRGTSRETAA